MDNFQRKYSNYSKALLRLKEAVKIIEPDDIHVDGIIQRLNLHLNWLYKPLKPI